MSEELTSPSRLLHPALSIGSCDLFQWQATRWERKNTDSQAEVRAEADSRFTIQKIVIGNNKLPTFGVEPKQMIACTSPMLIMITIQPDTTTTREEVLHIHDDVNLDSLST
jgi:hypothetical protein